MALTIPTHLRGDAQAAVWNAINQYAAACGGRTDRVSDKRMDAVAAVEAAIEAAFRTGILLALQEAVGVGDCRVIGAVEL